jgi:ribonuclease T
MSKPFPGANIDPRSLEITGIDPDNPLRGALNERDALDHIFQAVRLGIRENDCQRAILVGHNAAFDLGFLNAAVRRVGHKRNPFHPFSCLTPSRLSGLAYGQTVLAKQCKQPVTPSTHAKPIRRCTTPSAPRCFSAASSIVLRALEVLELERVGSALP